MTSIAVATPRVARPLLLSIWLGAFVVSLGSVAYVAARGWIDPSNTQLLLKELNALYAPFLSVMTLFYFKNKKSRPRSAESRDATAFYLAIGLSALWNAVVAGLTVRLVLGGAVEDVIVTMRDVLGIFSWLVGGGIGFYFGSGVDGPTARGPGE